MTEGRHRGAILFVVTGADEWTLNDGSKHKTGFWAEEAVVPLEVFREAGYDVTVATPGGVRPPVDEGSLAPDVVGPAERAAQLRHLVDTDPELQDPIALADADISEYDAVFVPGGHGPMEDLATDVDAGRLLIAADRATKTIGVVCHGPAVLLAALGDDGVNVFSGRTVTCFGNAEEQQGGLADKAPWLLEDRLTHAGFKVTLGLPWTVHTQADGNLLTGQNPASSEKLAREILQRLKKQAEVAV
ncbi:type 1 glutamine amidotransferase domain-containing protein [Gordonia paraffinivorans]|uniref:type 1 glutamine amidotransferase domain-containing protein n=1 Tax=Gordonia paraffinivorans TaxID=175628 RepID=UPI000D605945|nr:type 1 glutamine amidotransferase domain-containing protein [Gordonia paraffinivorans]MBY4572878.1 type 1 glutamine amidotransferase domain-containing protein [Gordonia paraffinivorans]PWD43607.1 type 1 glutamine amidotransferase domain-containing protein [Gordonia paraffinivorans]